MHGQHIPTPNPAVTDPERLAALRAYGVLDTAPEAGFDDVASIAADVCLAPVALVSFVDVERQWFKAKIGFDARQTPIGQSVCAHALAVPDMLVIPDLTRDPRTSSNSLVTDPPGVRFYAGVVLRDPKGQPLGTLCVLDDAPRPDGLTERQANALRALGRQVMALLELRKTVIVGVHDMVEQTRAFHERDAAAAALAENELRLRLAVDAARMGTFDYDLRSGGLDWDGRTRELFGVSPTDPVTYDGSFLAGVHPDDREAADRAVAAALDPAGPGIFDHEYRAVSAKDGAVRWLAARGQAIVSGGETVRFVGAVRDVTARRTADEAAAATLERYTLVGRVTQDVIWDWDLVSGHVLWNDALTTAYGHRMRDVEPTPDWWLERVHPDDRERVRQDIYRVIEGIDRDWTHEYRFLRADGQYAAVYDRGSMIRDPAGRPVRMIGAMLDNSVRKAEEERQRLLNHELGHRMKNLLTIVEAIASQTLRGADTVAEARNVLSGRLVALGKAQDVLLGGSSSAAQLSAIVAEAVRPHIDRPERVSTQGPRLDIGSKSALPIVLMMHELATNAAKYGALSNDEGRIAIVWKMTGRPGAEIVRLTWTERDGPPVAAPTRLGFGAKLIERGLAGQIGGTVKLHYAPSGVSCLLEAPLARLQETA